MTRPRSRCTKRRVPTLNTAGVTVGDPVLKTGKPLSVELGPGKSWFNRRYLRVHFRRNPASAQGN